MQIRLTVHGPQRTGPGADVLVTAPSGTTFAGIAGALRTASGTDGQRFWVGDVRLRDDTPVGRPPLVDGALVTVDALGSPSPSAGSPQLRVVGGPDAGGVHLLHQGGVRIGRAPEAEVRLGDPDLSRLHAELWIEPGRIRVADLDSTNGTTVDGMPIGRDPVDLPPGSLLRLGESTLQTFLPQPYGSPEDTEGARSRADGTGHIEVRRSTRAQLPVPARARFELPEETPGRRRPFALRRKAGGTVREAVEAKARSALLDEVRWRRDQSPDPATLLLDALATGEPGPSGRLWERTPGHPEALSVRLGVGDLPSRVTLVEAAGGADATGAPATAGDAGESRTLTAFSVPVTVSLKDAVLGLAGNRLRLLGLARSIVAQLAGLHGPQDLELVVLCADPGAAGDWSWARWLPHLRPAQGQDCRLLVGLTRDQVRARVVELLARVDTAERVPARRTVVVLDGAGSLAGQPEIVRLLAEGPAAGVHALCLDERAEELPLQCSVVAHVTGEVGTRLDVVGPGTRRVDDVVTDAVSSAWADRFARALAPLREATRRVTSPLPESVRLLDLLNLDLLTPAKLLAGWREAGHSPRVVLGADARGAVSADLSQDGPHIVIGGAAGSGRSELLASILCSLAVANRPDELTIALVRGPEGLAELPHIVGYLSDGDAPSSDDAIIAVRDELDRREGLLRGTAFEAYRAGAERPLPRLVVAVDDIDLLAEAYPGFVKSLADVAHRGGAHGVHLLVTTGRPARTPDIEAAAGAELRIALRVDDPQASRVLIDVEDAAGVDEDYPGRGFVRGGDGAVVPFQGGRITGRMPRTATLRPTVVRQEWQEMGNRLARRPTPVGGGKGPTDLALLTGAVRRAAEQLGASPQPPLWPRARLQKLAQKGQ
ncbi:FHA domain-containing protein [Streptomyces sp. SID3343]|uniref:FHA domain-containing protein n=1 Tax=Streptomyces sp. SID3343 TaxID=2690260 RepID=UPI00136A66F2|nr:FHA domain-containing protein [Streptomyces sp. SID3343]MYW00671.1 FHA domain-containing protein [Streptomyces sp. SID3343]